MSNNYDLVSFPLDGETLTLTINYCILSGLKGNTLMKLLLTFSIKQNKFPSNAPPTIKELLEVVAYKILNRFLPILGKNVYVTGIVINCNNVSINIPLYEFGLSGKPALPPETALFFVLQPYSINREFRLYVKGASTDFSKKTFTCRST